jgi:hypothetical protein
LTYHSEEERKKLIPVIEVLIGCGADPNETNHSSRRGEDYHTRQTPRQLVQSEIGFRSKQNPKSICQEADEFLSSAGGVAFLQ